MWPFKRKKPEPDPYYAAFRAQWDEYQAWSKAQPCVDCGALKDGKRPWVTEIQCWDCFTKEGSTERRGKGNAADMAPIGPLLR